ESKKMKRNFFVGTLIFVIIIGAFYINKDDEQASSSLATNESITSNVQSTTPKSKIAPLKEGEQAIDFELQTLTGDTMRLFHNDGKPTLINFWASWCPPCKKEMPDLQDAYEKYGDEVNFFMVNLSFNDDLDNMNAYIEENRFTFPILLDKTGNVLKDYEVIAIPTTYIVNKDNIITHKITGPMSKDTIQSIINEITSK